MLLIRSSLIKGVNNILVKLVSRLNISLEVALIRVLGFRNSIFSVSLVVILTSYNNRFYIMFPKFKAVKLIFKF